MTRYVARLSAVGLALGLTASPLVAQLGANPVYFSPKAPNGLTLAADFGTTLNGQVNGFDITTKPNNVGLRAILGLPLISLGLGGGIYDTDVAGADKEVQFMVSGALKLFSPPLVPVGLGIQAGAGYQKVGSGAFAVKTISVPIGIGVAVKPPTPSVSFEAWGAPRVQFNAVSFSGSSRVQAGVGGSLGVNLGMPMGLGLHVAADWLKLSAKTSAGAGSLVLPETQMLVLGVGLHYTFTIPGIPMVPII